MKITNRVKSALEWVQAQIIEATGQGQARDIYTDRSMRFGDLINITIETLDHDGCSDIYRVWENGVVTGSKGIPLYQI